MTDESDAMQVIVNGKSEHVAAGTLADMLVELDYADLVVATAVNGAFVPARRRRDQAIRPGDRIEIIAPMQGG